MRRHDKTTRGFTLIELMMVMIILMVVAAIVAPSMRGFIAGRDNNNTATQILGMASYARAQSVAEGRTYRLNFDTNARKIWLTYDDGSGTFKNLTGEFATPYFAASSVTMNVNVTTQFNINLMVPQNIQQEQVQQNGASINGQQLGSGSILMKNLRDNSTYVEFQSTGRADQADIKLTDRLGKTVEVACNSATDVFHILPAGGTR